jgi:hypothetical protein
VRVIRTITDLSRTQNLFKYSDVTPRQNIQGRHSEKGSRLIGVAVAPLHDYIRSLFRQAMFLLFRRPLVSVMVIHLQLLCKMRFTQQRPRFTQQRPWPVLVLLAVALSFMMASESAAAQPVAKMDPKDCTYVISKQAR